MTIFSKKINISKLKFLYLQAISFGKFFWLVIKYALGRIFCVYKVNKKTA